MEGEFGENQMSLMLIHTMGSFLIKKNRDMVFLYGPMEVNILEIS